MLLDLKVQPSPLFIAPNEGEAKGEEGGEGGGDAGGDVLDLNWHCKKGLASNIHILKQEFEKARNLKPIKVFITGPPAVGKSYFGE